MKTDDRPNAEESWRCNKCKKIPKKEDVPKMSISGKCVTCALGELNK